MQDLSVLVNLDASPIEGYSAINSPFKEYCPTLKPYNLRICSYDSFTGFIPNNGCST